MSGCIASENLRIGLSGSPEDIRSERGHASGFFAFTGVVWRREKKLLNIFEIAPKAWPNMGKEFFLDNPHGAWDVVRDFLRGNNAQNVGAHGKEDLGVN